MKLIDAEPYDKVLEQREKALWEIDAPAVADVVGQCRKLLAKQPTVDAVEVPDKKLLRAIKLLIKQYEHSKNSDYVHSPVAHALFHTWKQVEERRNVNA